MKKILTLCLAARDGQILLGMKKRGFGMGRWNGFGGKVEPGETIIDAAKREMFEESGVAIVEMEQVGIHEFEFDSKRGEILEVHVFRVDTFSNEPEESEEMKPKWFRFNDLPYDQMWWDDKIWLPKLIAGKKFAGNFVFGDDEKTIISQEFKET